MRVGLYFSATFDLLGLCLVSGLMYLFEKCEIKPDRKVKPLGNHFHRMRSPSFGLGSVRQNGLFEIKNLNA